MSKRSKTNKKLILASQNPPVTSPSSTAQRRPRVLFAVGDAEHGYTEGKIWQLVQRIQSQTGYDVVALTHEQEQFDAAKKHKLNAEFMPIKPAGVTVMDRLQATDEMIRETADIMIPGSHLPLWKVLAMDDFLASLQLFGAQPTMSLDGDLLVLPLMGIDNNTRGTCGLYTWAVGEARRHAIPVVGIEVSPLGNKNTLSHLPVDHFVVKSRWSKEFLLREGLAHADQVSLLRSEESYCLWPGRDEYVTAYLDNENKIRELLGVSRAELIVVIPHHVSFLWEVRKTLDALAQVQFPLTVVIRVDSRTVRRHYREQEIVKESYVKELSALNKVIIDDRVGVGLLLQLADVVIAPFAGTTTEHAALCRKPTIICQSMAQEGWRGEFTYWEPTPARIPALLDDWQQSGYLQRGGLSGVVERLAKTTHRAAAGDSVRRAS